MKKETRETLNKMTFSQKASMLTGKDSRTAEFTELDIPSVYMCDGPSGIRICEIFTSENKYLLTNMLRDEFVPEGMIVSDWVAVHDIALSIHAEPDLEMPCICGAYILRLVHTKQLRSVTLKLLFYSERKYSQRLTSCFLVITPHHSKACIVLPKPKLSNSARLPPRTARITASF